MQAIWIVVFYVYCSLLQFEVVKSDDNIPLKAIDVEGNFVDFVGRIKTTQKYSNNHEFNIEAKYQFNLDLESTVIGMKMVIGDRTLVSQIKEKKTARQEYNNAIKNNKTSSLLEKSFNGIYSMNVGNIPPGEDILIEVDYITALVANDAGDVKFVLPTNIGMKYTGGEKTGKDRVANQETISQMTYSSSAGYPFTLNINWTSNSNIQSVRSLTHPIMVTNLTDQSLNIRCQTLSSTGDFNLFATIAQRRFSMFTRQKGNDTYLMLNYRMKDDATVSSKSQLEKEYILLVDQSGSMADTLSSSWTGGNAAVMPREKIDYAKEACNKFIESLPENSRFNIVLFHSNYKATFSSSVPASKENRKIALQQLSGVVASGGTELLRVLSDVLNGSFIPESVVNNVDVSEYERAVSQRNIILLTDAEVTNGDALSHLIRRFQSNTRIFTVGIGSNVNRLLCNQISQSSNAYSTILIDNPNMSLVVQNIISRTFQPFYANISLHWMNSTLNSWGNVVYSMIWKSYYVKIPSVQWNSIVSTQTPFVLTGIDSNTNKKVSWTIPLDFLNNQPNQFDFIPQLYAADRIQQYEHEFPTAPSNEEIIRLSVSYHLMNSLTSFLVIDEKPNLKLANSTGSLRSITVPQYDPTGTSSNDDEGWWDDDDNYWTFNDAHFLDQLIGLKRSHHKVKQIPQAHEQPYGISMNRIFLLVVMIGVFIYVFHIRFPGFTTSVSASPSLPVHTIVPTTVTTTAVRDGSSIYKRGWRV
jgi:Ca-activated chloride channel family protein